LTDSSSTIFESIEYLDVVEHLNSNTCHECP
jgi:hypothetical protein